MTLSIGGRGIWGLKNRGITEAPSDRFSEHQVHSGYNSMDLWICTDSCISGNAEKAILAAVGSSGCCKNRSGGGERRSWGEPHFVYIVWKQ